MSAGAPPGSIGAYLVMHRALRLTAAALAFLGVTVWLFGGPNWGWTKTSVAHETTDPVTGLTQIVWEQNLLLGVDFLAAVLGGAGVIFGLSWCCRTRRVSPGEDDQSAPR